MTKTKIRQIQNTIVCKINDNQTLLWKADDNQISENQLLEEHPDALEPLEWSSPAPGLPFNFETTLQWKWRLYNLHKTRNGPRRGSQRPEEKKRPWDAKRLSDQTSCQMNSEEWKK